MRGDRGMMANNHTVLTAEIVRALVRLMEEHALCELTLEGEGFSITLKADSDLPAIAALPTSPAPAVEETARLAIHAPMTGVFYRSPAPNEPPFIEVGDLVEVGQVIGLIEAMKVFSEVTSDFAGRVVAIPAANGKPVRQGDVLVVLIPEENVHDG